LKPLKPGRPSGMGRGESARTAPPRNERSTCSPEFMFRRLVKLKPGARPEPEPEPAPDELKPEPDELKLEPDALKLEPDELKLELPEPAREELLVLGPPGGGGGGGGGGVKSGVED
jgi:hypothetical protein